MASSQIACGSKKAGLGAKEAVNGLLAELHRFVGDHRQIDDITMIAIAKR